MRAARLSDSARPTCISALLPRITLITSFVVNPLPRSFSGWISMRICSLWPPTTKPWPVFGMRLSCCSRLTPRRRRLPPSSSGDHSVSVTTGTSSMPLTITNGGICTPCGILSRFEASLSCTLTTEGPVSSPTLKRTVTMPCPRMLAE